MATLLIEKTPNLSLEITELTNDRDFEIDGLRLQQCLSNLLTNALKFSHTGVIIHLCATAEVLPQTMFPGNIITRPWDIYPLLLFLVGGLFLYVPFYKKNKGYFSHALLIGLIPEIFTQVYMAFGSTELFDNAFNIAHALKILAYLTPLMGLCLDYIYAHKNQKVYEKELALLNDELELRIARRTNQLKKSNESLQDQIIKLNELQNKNEVLQKRLISNAFKEGFAENAVSVLHNIGNALTGIIMTSADNKKMTSLLSFPKILTSISKKFTIELQNNNLENYFLNDPKGESVLGLLTGLSTEIETIGEKLSLDCHSIHKQLGDVAEIISLQQNYANLKNKVKTSISLNEVLSDVLALYKKDFVQNKIKVIEDFQTDCNIHVEKNGLAQSFGNFIQNAKHAILEKKNRSSFLCW